MIVNAYGVIGPTTHGYGFTRIPSMEIESELLPVMAGGTPVGSREWYTNPPFEHLVISPDCDNTLVPMRGSKRGIASTEYSGRVYAYEYRMAALAGQKFGRRFRETGLRTITLSAKRDSFATMRHRMGEIVQEEFRAGFYFGVRGLSYDHDRLSSWDSDEQKGDIMFMQNREFKSGEVVGVSSVYCAYLGGMPEDAKAAFRAMARNTSSIEAMEGCLQ